MTETDIAPGWRVDEGARAETIAQHDLGALGQNPALTRITDFAAALCDAPVALVSVVEEARQLFLAHTGTDITETPRSVSFCQHAMVGDTVMIVPDAKQDPRFADNALVTGAPYIRFYAGAPIVASDGVPLGALCVIDAKTREVGLTPLQRQGLSVLAEAVVQLFDRNRRLLPG
jgi:GAF domain-containing protein